MSKGIKTEHKVKHVETTRVHPDDVKPGRNSRMIAAHNYLDVLTKLAISIAKHGQLQPAEVRRDEDKTLVMVDGQTRQDAVKVLRDGFTAIDPDTGEEVLFRDPDATLWVKIVDVDPDTAFLHSIKANQDREGTTDLQEALAQNELRTTMGWSDTKIARFYGYSNQNRVMALEKLLRLPNDVQQAVHDGRMALSIALLTLDLTDEERAKTIEQATGEGGKISGPALKNIIRELFAVRGSALPEAVPTPEESGAEKDKKEGGVKDDATDPKVNKYIRRSAKDFERFFAEHKDDTDALSDRAVELINVMVLWFKGRRTDEYLRTALNEYTE